MLTIANIFIGLIAFVHIYILVLEMFLWDKPVGLRAFGQTQAAATASKVLAANQGFITGSSLPVCSGAWVLAPLEPR